MSTDLAAEEARAERLEAAVLRLASLRDEVLALLVHDVRTPLGVVLGNCELLLEELAGPLTDKQRRLLDAIQRQAGNLEGAVEGLRVAALEVDPTGQPQEAPSVLRRLQGRPGARVRLGAPLGPNLGPYAASEALLAAQVILEGLGMQVLTGRPAELVIPLDGEAAASLGRIRTELDALRPRIRGVRRAVEYIVELDDALLPGQMNVGVTG